MEKLSFCINTAKNEKDYTELLLTSMEHNFNSYDHEIIIFIDSDDYLINNSLKKLAHLVQNNNGINLVIFTHYIMKVGNRFIKSKNIFFKNFFKCKLNDLFEFYISNFCHAFCWSYVFERDFIMIINFIVKIDCSFIKKSINSKELIALYKLYRTL